MRGSLGGSACGETQNCGSFGQMVITEAHQVRGVLVCGCCLFCSDFATACAWNSNQMECDISGSDEYVIARRSRNLNRKKVL